MVALLAPRSKAFPTEAARHYYQLSKWNQDEVILGTDGHHLVSSRTSPGEYHVVSAHGCTCQGYRTRHVCRHLVRVACELRGLYLEDDDLVYDTG